MIRTIKRKPRRQYSAAEKIRFVLEGLCGEKGLEDKRSGPNKAWNRVPEKIQAQIIDLALECPELSPRKLAVANRLHLFDGHCRLGGASLACRLIDGDVTTYIEMFYNPKRKHANNGMLSPAEFERQQKLKPQGV
ncbi:MAG: hypothetical protein K8F25_00380 [Fimbriimonadaceae bacterium]|nr:hypothetical protein [Alphaproteobacteria bacterium]